MFKNLKIVKIGGSVLRDGKSYLSIASKVREITESGNKIVIVVSAMKGVTDNLLEALRGSREALGKVIDKYVDAATYIGGKKLLGRVSYELAKLKTLLTITSTKDPALTDLELSFGERLSKILLTEALVQEGVKSVGIDATEVIKTDNNHGNASIRYYETLVRVRNYLIPLLREGTIPVIEGFIGSTLSGEVTTLGRGGSDYTATTIASLLKASKVYLITNVPGILSADPKLVNPVRIVPKMSYREALEASIYGCKNLHPKTFYPLMNVYGIDVHIGTWDKNTLIQEVVSDEYLGPKLIASRIKGYYGYVALIGDRVNNHEVIGKVIDLLKDEGLKYEGIYIPINRPSIIIIFNRTLFANALNSLHELIIEGELYEV